MNSKIIAIAAVAIVVIAGAGAAIALMGDDDKEEKKGWYAWDPTVCTTSTTYFTLSPNLYNGAAKLYKDIYGKDVDTTKYKPSDVPAEFMAYTSLIKSSTTDSVTIDSTIREKTPSLHKEHMDVTVPIDDVDNNMMICTGSYAVLLYKLYVYSGMSEADAEAKMWTHIYALDKSAFPGQTADLKVTYGLTIPDTVKQVTSTYYLEKQENLAQYVSYYSDMNSKGKHIITMMSGSLADNYSAMIANYNKSEGFLYVSEQANASNLFYYSDDIPEVLSAIEALGAAFGLQTQAHNFVEEVRVNYYNLSEQAKLEKSKTVYMESRGGSSCCGTDNITASVFEYLNLKNIVTGAGWVKNFGDENVVLQEPQVIIFYDNDGRTMDQCMRVETTTA